MRPLSSDLREFIHLLNTKSVMIRQISTCWRKPGRHVLRMLSSGLKYELDALANKDFQYLTKSYLPRKLKEKDWLD